MGKGLKNNWFQPALKKIEENLLRKHIEIGIVDNDVYEEDEQFLVKLSQVSLLLSADW